jgi:hypothetical protein
MKECANKGRPLKRSQDSKIKKDSEVKDKRAKGKTVRQRKDSNIKESRDARSKVRTAS